jgi:error-prone DNA polymerase
VDIDGRKCVRLGLNYVRGLRKETGQAIVAARREAAFRDENDLVRRVPELRKDELRNLAEVGALNHLRRENASHRRDALWRAEAASRPVGPLLEALPAAAEVSPLAPMTAGERIHADFRGTGLTVGPHPLAMRRAELDRMGVASATALAGMPDGCWVRVAGCIICRQRPGTAKGFVFLSMEDETGISNVIVLPDLFEQFKITLMSFQYLVVEGVLQNLTGVVSVKLRKAEPLHFETACAPSHDFH